MNEEQKFWDALRDLFVGAKIEGESGYINLMRIKSRYYTEGVFPRLKRDIDEEKENQRFPKLPFGNFFYLQAVICHAKTRNIEVIL